MSILPSNIPVSRVTIIDARNQWWKINWIELWNVRHLAVLFAKRTLATRYKQSIFGPAWFVLQPLMTAFVFYFVFGVLLNLNISGMPRMLHYLSGVAMWSLFVNIFKETSLCFVRNTKLFSKIYFPRFAIPIATSLESIVLFLLNLLILLGFFAYYHISEQFSIHPNIWLCAMPLCVLYVSLTALGFGFLVASLTVRFRDLQFALNTIIQFWMYATPIIWARSAITNFKYLSLVWWNPMTAPVEIFRYGLTGANPVALTSCLPGLYITLVAFCAGVLAFNRAQRNFVDLA